MSGRPKRKQSSNGNGIFAKICSTGKEQIARKKSKGNKHLKNKQSRKDTIETIKKAQKQSKVMNTMCCL